MSPAAPASSVGVCSFGRAQSQRCPNKMLRPFGETTLTDIVLQKLAHLPYESFFAGYEEAFRSKSEQAGVRFIQRDQRSVTIDEPIRDILSFLEQVHHEQILIINPCLPFLKVQTILRFLEQCQSAGCWSAFGVMRRQNYFLGLDRLAVNFDMTAHTINTKTVAPIHEFAHALYFF